MEPGRGRCLAGISEYDGLWVGREKTEAQTTVSVAWTCSLGMVQANGENDPNLSVAWSQEPRSPVGSADECSPSSMKMIIRVDLHVSKLPLHVDIYR